MNQYLLDVVYESLDPSRDEAACFDDLGVVGVERLAGGEWLMSALLDDDVEPLEAAVHVVDALGKRFPGAKPIRAWRDLVGVTDIAERVGVSRETVRTWESGKRRDGDFPRPCGEVGRAKVWEWGAVNAWLSANLNKGDGLRRLNTAELGLLDAYIAETISRDAADERRRAAYWGLSRRHWSNKALFASYRQMLTQLKERLVVRTENAPAGDYAEYLVARALGGELQDNSTKGYDLLVGDQRIQVKSRVISPTQKTGERQLGKFSSEEFDQLVVVLLSSDDYSIRRAARLLKPTVLAGMNQRGVVIATDSLLDLGEDLTELLQQVE